MHLQELDYHLPEQLIAQEAVEPRDHSRLLVIDRTDRSLTDRHFYDLPDYLADGDVLVLNDTKVIPARITLRKTTGGQVEGLFLRQIEPGLWEMMFKGMAKLKEDMKLTCDGSNVRLKLKQRLSPKTYSLQVRPEVSAVDFFNRHGQVPLPPYIRGASLAEDSEKYQTVYSRQAGAVAAPTAGLHFTPQLLEKIKAMGVQIATITLHVGMGTFEPVTADDLTQHHMHSEWYELNDETVQVIRSAKERGKKIIAVGTTCVRVLEAAAADQDLQPSQGWTNIFIYPPYQFKIVDRLVTNFHLPRTTLLAMIFAFAGKELTLQAYRHAIDQQYRFYSYGDATLIL